MKTPSVTLCPCGTGKAFDACCARWHVNLQAPTAEALMRSRYSAYVLKNETYLLATWHVTTRPPSLGFEAHTKWLGLVVNSATETGADKAEVDFVARYRVGGNPAVRLHERSRFVREDGQWFYVDAAALD